MLGQKMSRVYWHLPFRLLDIHTSLHIFLASLHLHPNKIHPRSSHKGKQLMSHSAKVFSRVLKSLLPALNLEYTFGGGGLVPKSCPTFATPWTVAWQALLSMGFSRQED